MSASGRGVWLVQLAFLFTSSSAWREPRWLPALGSPTLLACVPRGYVRELAGHRVGMAFTRMKHETDLPFREVPPELARSFSGPNRTTNL